MNEKIAGMKDVFYQAHNGTSFSPDIRATQCVNEYSALLSEDLSELGEKAGDYEAKYIKHLKDWMSKKSRCMSSMIAGPSNFPFEKNRKAFMAEQKAYEDFQAWRERYIKSVNRVPVKSPEEEIDDALLKLEKERNAHTLMVEVNKVFRKKISDDDKRRLLLEELEISEKMIERIMTPDCYGKFGFASWALTNSNARIKNLEQKVLIMKNRIVRREAFEPIQISGGVIDIKDDHVVIIHEVRPDAEIISALKARGFHWSGKNKYWCRKHTANALRDARYIFGIK